MKLNRMPVRSAIPATVRLADEAITHGVPIVKGTDAYLSYPKQSTAAKGSHAFLGNGDSVAF
jgi:hypothetical protein